MYLCWRHVDSAVLEKSAGVLRDCEVVQTPGGQHPPDSGGSGPVDIYEKSAAEEPTIRPGHTQMQDNRVCNQVH